MTAPMDPNNMEDGPTEFSWGAGIFPPGISDTKGNSFGPEGIGDIDDNYANAVADRRTDSTDPDSGRDFYTLGNPDRFGPNPPLIKEDSPSNVSQRDDRVERDPLQRRG